MADSAVKEWPDRNHHNDHRDEYHHNNAANGGDDVAAESVETVTGHVERVRRRQVRLATRAWKRRELSNFDYLMTINTLAGELG